MEFVLDFNQNDADHLNSINQQIFDRAGVDFSEATHSVYLLSSVSNNKKAYARTRTSVHNNQRRTKVNQSGITQVF